MALLEFVVDGPPVSQQARRRRRLHDWKAEVRQAAARYWPEGQLPLDRSLMLTVTYFYDDPDTRMDVDNIPKPISDSLNGLAYTDDVQITDCLVRKRSLSALLEVQNPSDVLAEGLSRGTDFLYIVLDHAPDQTTFG